MERRGRYVLDRGYPWNYPQSRLFSLIFEYVDPTKAEHRLSGLIRWTSLFLDHLWSIKVFILRKSIRFLNLIIIFADVYSFFFFLYFFSKKEEQSMRCYRYLHTYLHSIHLLTLITCDIVINDLNTRSVPCFANRSVYTIGVSIKRRPNA